jgi:methyl-accepting chemotaxis protein
MLDAMGSLVEIIERDRGSLREPMMQLSASAEALAAMAKAISERPADTAPAEAYAATGEELKKAIDRLAAKIEQLAERPTDVGPASYAATGEELKTAIDQLTEKIQQQASLRLP